MGVDIEWEFERLTHQFQDIPPPHLFEVILAITSTWLQKLEQSRWSLDFSVLRLEQESGYGQLLHNVKPLASEKMSQLRNDIAGAQGYIRSVARHSSCLGEIYKFFAEAVVRFDALGSGSDCTRQQQILDSLAQYQTQQKSQMAQAHDLSWRIDSQWSVLVALMAKHDSDVTISMAADAKTENMLMRRMAVVSIIFLPATFLATFFSMIFFHVNEQTGALSVSRNIWVYFVSTTTISLSIVLYFRVGSKCTEAATKLRGRV